ncbi:MAG: hypothetical protein WC841_05320 [Candidatus Shapirobacteria bacterium]|jgi:hypothetical protein
MGEREIKKEGVLTVSDVMVITKTMRDLCPLAEMVFRSGLDGVVLGKAQYNTTSRSDFQVVATAGNTGDMWYPDLAEVSERRPFAVANRADGKVAIGILTRYTDQFGRVVPLHVILREIAISGPKEAYGLMTRLFPNLSFEETGEELTYSDMQGYAEKNIVPCFPLPFPKR